MSHALQQLRQLRADNNNLVRANTVSSLPEMGNSGLLAALGYAILGLIIGGIGWGIYTQDFALAVPGAQWGAMIFFVWYVSRPLRQWISAVLKHRCWPSVHFFGHFPAGQLFLCVMAASWGLVFMGNHTYPYVATLWQKPVIQASQNGHKSSPHHEWHKISVQVTPHGENANLPLKSTWMWGVAWLLTALLLSEIISRIQRRRFRRWQNQEQEGVEKIPNTTALPFSLWLGRSTGQLAERAHGAGLAAHQKIALELEDAAQNILVLGGIGSGKTTRAMHPLLLQLLDQECGGLIFDVKGDFQTAVLTFAEQTQRPVTLIGPGFEKMNLLAGLSPEMAASFLKSAFLLSGKGHGEAFWIDTATELCRNTLGLLSFVPNAYSLQGLYGYLFDVEERLAVDETLDALLPTLDAKALRLLKSYGHYHEKIFDKFDEKVKAGVNATIAQVLSPFNHPELVEAFCSSGENHVPMEAVLNGAVYLVSLPLSVWGLGGKVVYSLIKLRFYNVMQQRATRSAWNQERPVFFMCDEFQEIVSANKDGLSDLNFWDKSRSSKTIGIISAQAVSSFYAAIGDRDIAHALLQNFRQKICFRTEDTTTLTYFNNLADKVEVIRKSHSHTTGKQNQPDKIFSSKSISDTENTTLVEKSVLSPQLFRNLQPDQAIALLSIQGHSMDDVMGMMPVFVSAN